MSEILRSVAGFYDSLLASLSKGTFATTSMVVVSFLFALAAIAGVGKVWFDWLKTADRSQSMPALALDFAQKAGGLALVWLFVGLTPILFGSISGSVLGTLKGLNAQVASPAANLMDQAESAIKMIWSSQMAVQQNFARESSFLLAGYQSGVAQHDDAQAVSAEMAKAKGMALQAVASQKAEANQLMKSSKPEDQKRGASMLAAARSQETLIKSALSQADLEEARALSVAQAQDDDAGFQVTRGLTAVVTVGISELIFLIQRVIVGVIGFIIVAVPLVLAMMMAWKLLQSVVSLFSHLTVLGGIISLAAALSSVLGPLMVVTFATQEWKRFGQAFVNFWLQAICGISMLALAVKLCATGIGSLAGMCSVTAFSVYSRVTASTGIMQLIIDGATSGLAFMAAAFTFQVFTDFAIKSPHAGIGLISGSFHP